MPDGGNVAYYYDGSFDGMLCCVFESYAAKEIPDEILPPEALQATFLPAKAIVTDKMKAERVRKSIPEKMGAQAYDFIRHAFLTNIDGKEYRLLLFIRLGFKHGPKVMRMISEDAVYTLLKAVRHLNNESHLLKGFIRFSAFHGALVAEIEPKNIVLPLLAKHFRERFPGERFIIFDRTNDMALIYEPYRHRIIPASGVELPEPDEAEQKIRELWKLFYNTIEVEGRYNPKCRMSHMPKHYWKYMTEFETPGKPSPCRAGTLKNPSGLSLPAASEDNSEDNF
ncbi:MAG: TIGR03915 family putative DNA repair protein [Bacillota bacterium]|nr:TIGR03915 family putative DNA repair protein [Bacillota bacterium]